MKLLRSIADKLYKYSSYYEKPKPFTIVKEQKQIIRISSSVNLTGEVQEETAKRILVSAMKDQLEKLIKVEKMLPNLEYPNSVEYRGELKVIEE